MRVNTEANKQDNTEARKLDTIEDITHQMDLKVTQTY